MTTVISDWIRGQRCSPKELRRKRIRATLNKESRVKHSRLLFNSVYNIWNINMHIKTQIMPNHNGKGERKNKLASNQGTGMKNYLQS